MRETTGRVVGKVGGWIGAAILIGAVLGGVFFMQAVMQVWVAQDLLGWGCST